MTRAVDCVKSPMSSAQQALWVADGAMAGNTQYNLGRVVHCDGPLDVASLTAALAELTARHEALRARVRGDSGQFMLEVEPPGAVNCPVIHASEAESDVLAESLVTRPFTADEPTLWRAQLHRIGAERHRLVLVMHHLIADTGTIALMLAEIAALYRATLAGEPPALPAARPFSEFVAWESDFVGSADCAAQVAYWTHQVIGIPPLELPSDRPRQPTSRHPGENLRFTVPAQIADALRVVARDHGATLAHVLLACYATMLARHARRDDLLVGMPLSIRHGDRWGRSVGLFVNTVPIKVSLHGNPPFSQLLADVRGTLFAALGAAEAPQTTIATDASALRSAGTGRLYDVIFGLTSRRLTIDLPGITSQVTALYAGQAKFDLHLEIIDDGQGAPLAGVLEYDTDLFDGSTAQQFCDGFAAIATAVSCSPDEPVGNMALWRRAGADDVPGPLPGGGRVDTLFASAVAANPASVAMVDASSGAEYSYADLAGWASTVSAALRERGIGRGDFVGITLPRSAELVVAILGVLTAGAAYVPLDASYPVKRLADMAETASIRLIIGDGPAGLGVPVIDLPARDTEAAAGPAGDAGTAGAARGAGTDADCAYVMFTSGSAGEPKAVVIPHRGIVRLVRGGEFATMTAGERWLHCASPSFDASTLELWAPLLNGGSVVVLPGMPTVADLGNAIRRHKVTSMFLTTGLFNLVVDTDVEVLRPLRELISGGEVASANHMRQALRVVPTVVNAYGPTENTTFSACWMNRDPAQLTTPVPIGIAVTGSTVHVVDAYLNDMPPGAAGEIVTGGSGLAIGYANAPARTAERFVPNPFGPPGSRLYRTGDFGKLDADGVLHFAGRIDDQVKVRGFRVELGAIEHAVATHPGVSQVAVAVHADPTGDRRLIGYTVGAAEPADLTEHLRGQLPGYMIPGQWITLDALPLGPTGKVDRAALPAPVSQTAGPQPAASAAQDLLVAWYAELLGLDGVSDDTDFFVVGGHSLFAARLVSRIKACFGVELSISVVYDNPRIGDLAVAVAQSSGERSR